MAENSNQIKERMLKNASRMWGYSVIEEETAFDPLVGLILQSCAAELEGISRDISASQVRVTQKLIELMNPGAGSGIYPSHAIVRSLPVENTHTITPETKFFCQPVSNGRFSDDVPNTYYIPAGTFKLFNGNLHCMVFNEKLYVNKSSKERKIFQLGHTSANEQSALWFGVLLDTDIESIEGMNFYFDIGGSELRKSFIRHIMVAEWSVNGQPLIVKEGLEHNKDDKWLIDNVLEGKSTRFEECLNNISDNYKSYFWQIIGSPKLNRDKESSGPLFSKDVGGLNQLKNEMVWIKIKFQTPVNFQIIENLVCQINAFPVANLVSRRMVVRTKEHLNLIPLNTENDYFFDLKKVEDSFGDQYFENRSYTGTDERTKTYIIRTDGVQSFDKRSARELLQTALEKVKDENASFRFLNLPSVSDDLRTLHQVVSKLEMNMNKSPELKRPVFLYLEGTSTNDHIFIEFWTTYGGITNGITPDSKLEVFEGSALKPGSSAFITNTRGGQDKLSQEDQINEYRQSLLSRGRIVTNEDLKAFAFSWFGKSIKDVDIKKGTMVPDEFNKGLLRCIDIYLSMFDTYNINEETKMWCKDFLFQVGKKSNNTFPYRIFMNNKLID